MGSDGITSPGLGLALAFLLGPSVGLGDHTRPSTEDNPAASISDGDSKAAPSSDVWMGNPNLFRGLSAGVSSLCAAFLAPGAASHSVDGDFHDMSLYTSQGSWDALRAEEVLRAAVSTSALLSFALDTSARAGAFFPPRVRFSFILSPPSLSSFALAEAFPPAPPLRLPPLLRSDGSAKTPRRDGE